MNATSTPRERHFPRPTKEMAAGKWMDGGEKAYFFLGTPSMRGYSSCWHVLLAAHIDTFMQVSCCTGGGMRHEVVVVGREGEGETSDGLKVKA